MMQRRLFVVAPLVAAACLATTVIASQQPNRPVRPPFPRRPRPRPRRPRPTAIPATQPAVAPASPSPVDALKRLPWRNIGPTAQAGRVPVFVGLPGDINTMYVAGAVGGIFKTTNGGVSWKAIFDDQPVVSIGAIAIAPSDPNVIYAGTGEGNPRNDASIGDGVYKSIDAGEHWTNVGLPDSEKIARLVDRSAQPRRRLRLRAGPRVGPERGARPLQDDRRRPELEEDPLQERPHRLLGRRHRPDQRQHRLRGDVHVPALGLVHGVGRRRDGRLQVVRRRRDVDATVRARRQPRPAEGPDGPHRHRRRAQQPEHRLRHQRDEGRGRALAHRRRGRDLADGEPRPEHQLPAVLLRRHPRRSAEPEHRLRAGGRPLQVRGRRPHLRAHRHGDARRPPGDVDRPDQPDRAS